jgi:large subunit ribosomal protein L15e
MGAYKYIKESMEKEYKERGDDYKAKITLWRHAGSIVRVDRPANLTRARELGYKAKTGISVVRVRIGKGRRKRQRTWGGRKPRHRYLFVQPQLSHQALAEQRCARVYRNMEVLNSYWVGEDGNYKFFEIILADPSLLKSMNLAKGRAFRGLTSAGKRARGLQAHGYREQRTVAPVPKVQGKKVHKL